MKKILSLVLIFCLVFAGIIFSGCGANGIKLEGLPAYADAIYGNGGMVVTKGDYVYFASGFVEKNKLGKDFSNTQGTVDNGGLYRGRIETAIIEDEEVEIFESELMVSKIVGFENGGLYIFKDKIYFASPSIVRDNTGVRYDLITFYSCNLDGSGLSEFYQTTQFGTGAKYSMTMIDGNVYLLIYTGSKIIRVSENRTVTEMANDVTQAIFPTSENILNNEENPVENEQYVYYTKNTEPENPNSSINLGNTLYRRNIVTNEETLLFQDYSIEEGYAIQINLISLNAGRLFYTRNTKHTETKYHFSNSFDEEVFTNSEKQHIWGNSTSFIALGEKDETNLGVAFIFNSKLFVRGLNQGIDEVKELEGITVTSFLTAQNGFIYYLQSNDLYRVSATSNDPSREKINGSLKPHKSAFDIDNQYFYFFGEDKDVASEYSMYRIPLSGLTAGTSTPEKMN